MRKNWLKISIVCAVAFSLTGLSRAADETDKGKALTEEEQKFQKKFEWWPTDATPAPVEDKDKGGYWWMPTRPGPKSGDIWGNRGYVYIRKIIFDYKEEELPAPKPHEMRPSLIIKKILKNVKVYFDYDKADLRDDSINVLQDSIKSLQKNPDASILITGNCDIRGTEKYNEKLGKERGAVVKAYMDNHGIPQDRIRIISRGKLDAIAPVTDLVGMAKDRNAQFMVAVVEEVNIPYPGKPEDTVSAGEEMKQVGENKYLVEKEEQVEGEIKVTTKNYVVKKGDTLWKISQSQLGDGKRWNNIYRLNKKKIKDPNRLKAGIKIVIPVE